MPNPKHRRTSPLERKQTAGARRSGPNSNVPQKMSTNSSSVALQSLTATYTDSEGEEEVQRQSRHLVSSTHNRSDEDDERQPGKTQKSIVQAPNTISPDSNKSGTNTPQSGSSISAAEIRRVAARLVSYNNDEAMSDDEDDDQGEDSNSHVAFPVIRSSRPVSPEASQINLLPGEELLPPEPAGGRCHPELQEKISNLYEKMRHKGMNMNQSIQQRKQFRNPSLYEKLIDHMDLEELGTNYPESIYNPKQWSEESYYENLSKVQREEMDRREKERRDRTKVEFVSGTASKAKTASDATDAEKKRKSKWDQTLPASNASATSQTGAAVLTNMATGTKTAIPAFGNLPKKAKIP